ncbi:MAG: flagellar basal body rod protein FlgB, partial [Phycisphaerae bacterium]
FIAFSEARHRMVTENIANIDTPGYRTKQLDVGAFQRELRRASDAREAPTDSLRLRSSKQFEVNRIGSLSVSPETAPPENLLFHDGTNGQLERQMAMLADNGMAHQLAIELLKGNYNGILKAIRGRVQ